MYSIDNDCIYAGHTCAQPNVIAVPGYRVADCLSIVYAACCYLGCGAAFAKYLVQKANSDQVLLRTGVINPGTSRSPRTRLVQIQFLLSSWHGRYYLSWEKVPIPCVRARNSRYFHNRHPFLSSVVYPPPLAIPCPPLKNPYNAVLTATELRITKGWKKKFR
jgi:hypothetical protein